MPNIREGLPGDDKLKALIIGPYKIGKSWGAGTWPRPNFMDFDHGISLFRNPEFVKKYGLRDIQYQQFSEKNLDSRGVVKTHNAFDDACRYFDECMKPGRRDSFDTWVVDSGTTMSECASNKAIILLGGKELSSKPLSFTHQAALKTGLVQPRIQDFGAERSMVEQFIDMVRDTDKHFVFICHEKQIMNEAEVVTDVVPLLTGKSATAVPLKFEEVWFLRVKKDGPNTIRYLQTHADTVRRCGTHLGIPDGTSWEWDAIQSEVGKIRSEQALVASQPQSATPSLQREA
jgi:AAA domain-containing protein